LRRYDLRQAQYADLSDGVGSEMSPAVSPDGATIAFSRRSGISPAMQIWLAPAIGGPPQRLTRDGDHQDTQAVWSLDGAQLAFVRRTISGVAQSSAWIVDREGGEPRLLLENVTQLVWAA
jgi:Tol biopolymer transport system component